MRAIIPFKETSVRCPDKNFYLFPYVIKWLKNQNISLEIYVVTKSEKVKQFLSSYDVNIINEDSIENPSDITATFNAAKIISQNEWFLYIPLTQPFRENGIIQRIIKEKSDDVMFLTTYVEMQDRSIFEIDEKSEFKIESEHHMGRMCKDKRILDGSLYYVNPKMIDLLSKSKDFNHDFWHSKFKAIRHNMFQNDIDTTNQLNCFLSLKNIFSVNN